MGGVELWMKLREARAFGFSGKSRRQYRGSFGSSADVMRGVVVVSGSLERELTSVD